MSELKLAELIGSLSYALDLTEGQPAGHCVRCCWIGMHIGRQLGMSDDALWSLYLETRIITVADIFDAITAERPYHPPTPVLRTLEIMRAAVGSAIDADCFAALERVVARELQEEPA